MLSDVPHTERALHAQIALLRKQVIQLTGAYQELQMRFRESGKIILAFVRDKGKDGKLAIRKDSLDGIKSGMMLDMHTTDKDFYVFEVVSNTEAKKRMKLLEENSDEPVPSVVKLEAVKDDDSDTRVDSSEAPSEDGVDV